MRASHRVAHDDAPRGGVELDELLDVLAHELHQEGGDIEAHAAARDGAGARGLRRRLGASVGLVDGHHGGDRHRLVDLAHEVGLLLREHLEAMLELRLVDLPVEVLVAQVEADEPRADRLDHQSGRARRGARRGRRRVAHQALLLLKALERADEQVERELHAEEVCDHREEERHVHVLEDVHEGLAGWRQPAERARPAVAVHGPHRAVRREIIIVVRRRVLVVRRLEEAKVVAVLRRRHSRGLSHEEGASPAHAHLEQLCSVGKPDTACEEAEDGELRLRPRPQLERELRLEDVRLHLMAIVVAAVVMGFMLELVRDAVRDDLEDGRDDDEQGQQEEAQELV